MYDLVAKVDDLESNPVTPTPGNNQPLKKQATFDTDMTLELVKTRTAGEVYAQVNEFK